MGTAPRLWAAAASAAGGPAGESAQEGLTRLEAELETAEAEMVQAMAEQQGARARGVEAGRELERAQRDIPKMQQEIEALGEEVKELQRRLQKLGQNAEPSREELDHLEALQEDLAQQRAAAEACRQGFTPLKEKADALWTCIQEAGKGPLGAQSKKIASARKRMEEVCSKVKQFQVVLGSGEKAVERLEKGVAESKEEAEKEMEAQGKLKEELKALEGEAFTVHEEFNKCNTLLSERKEEHEGAKKEYAKLKQKVDKMRGTEVEAQLKLDDARKRVKACADSERALGAKLKAQEQHVLHLQAQLTREGMDRSRADAEAGAGLDPDEALERMTAEEAQRREAELVTQLKALKPNMAALEEYRKKQASYEERVGELEGVTREREEARRAHEELRKRRLEEFMAGFGVISARLKEMYQMITLGGDAELELVDSLDPFSEGIVFSVRPPKKSWKNICNLSGGEKTLSSLALVFALHHYKPTPLYVMDEIDAALDFKNVSIVAHYIKDRTKNAQFVIISLRNNMFELADHLVGIYKTHNATKSITINPNSFSVGPAPAPHSPAPDPPAPSSPEADPPPPPSPEMDCPSQP